MEELTATELRLSTFNCFSIRRKIDLVRDLLINNDVIMCQEIILLEDDCHILNQIDDNFTVHYVPSAPANSVNGDGRPVGGMALFIRKTLDIQVVIKAQSANYMVAEIRSSSYVFYLINLYMPCDGRDINCLLSFQNVLGELCVILDDLDSVNVVLAGDFNADKYKGRFWPYVEEFITANGLKLDDANLPADSFTFLSASHNTTSWIDHVVSSHNMVIKGLEILYDYALYDHFPVSFKVEAAYKTRPSVVQHDCNDLVSEFVDWSLFDNMTKQIYNRSVFDYMKNITVCKSSGCEGDCRDEINTYYYHLVQSFKSSSLAYSFIRKKSNRFKMVPGWNDFCKTKYAEARAAFLVWVRIGKPRYGYEFAEMKTTRKSFRKALNYCKKNEENIRDAKLVNYAENKNVKGFWKEVNLRRTHTERKSDIIDGLKTDAEIVNMFAGKFQAVTGTAFAYEYSPAGNTNFNSVYIENDNVKKSIESLNVGIGFDGIHSNHLKFLDETTIPFITELFNACLMHSYVPPELLQGVIVPRIKNKYGDKQDSKNYREVMNSSNLFKILEYSLLPKIQRYNPVSRYQMGYRPNTSTLLATAIFKETVYSYMNEGSQVYTCFLDLSKAFEYVNHNMLLRKMQVNGTPDLLLRLMQSIFSSSVAKVDYNGRVSDSWHIRRGVRQGGVLSAHLFCVYIDEILTNIAKLPFTCRLGINKVNVQAYADDIVVFCPTAMGLRAILAVLNDAMSSHFMCVNVDKTKVLVFSRNDRSNDNLIFSMGGRIIETVSKFKYLGTILSYNLCDTEDLIRLRDKFSNSVGMFYRKFGSLPFDVKCRLLRTLCMSFYGSELWASGTAAASAIRQFSVSYHASLKRLFNIPKYFSNHIICSLLDTFTFKHLLNFNILRFFSWMSRCNSPCFVMHRKFFIKHSYFKQCIERVCFTNYEFRNFLENDFNAVVARIRYVQTNESATYFVGF